MVGGKQLVNVSALQHWVLHVAAVVVAVNKHRACTVQMAAAPVD